MHIRKKENVAARLETPISKYLCFEEEMIVVPF